VLARVFGEAAAQRKSCEIRASLTADHYSELRRPD
jgi:hypothetical protein